MADTADTSFAELLAAAQSGDEVAFSALWRRWHPMLVRYLRVLAPTACDDIASEVWLQVMRSLGRFDGDDAGFTSWLFTIARNKLTDWRRRERRRPTEPLGDAITGDDTIAISDDDTETTVLARLDTDAALRLIAKLPAEQAEIVMLRVVAGLEVAEVADIVRKSPGAVRVSSHRALNRLRQMLAQSGELGQAAKTGVTR